MTNLEQYFLAVNLLNAMLKQGIITGAEYKQAERFFAEENCIKKGSIYRQNDLINSSKRVIYSVPKIKEARNGDGKKG